jgi:hypothetical protein
MSFEIPDACTLPTAERPLRLAEFDDLFATAVRRVEPIDATHARWHLTGPAGLADRVRDLTARETECCSFFTFTISGDVIVDVEVPPAYADVLAALTQRAVAARLEHVQAEIAARNRRAAAAGAGSAAWAAELGENASLVEEAARLQAFPAVGAAYHFPRDATAEAPALACDLAADGGDARHRIGVWQQALAHVQRRDPLPDTPDGVALRFPFDVELAGTLGRLAAAEYRCCSFGSYTLIVDDTGLRLEIRMPADAAGMLAAVVGLPDAGDSPC